MNNFVQKSERSVELPLGCKDLIDLEDIRSWTQPPHPHWLMGTSDQLAYMEGYLARLLQSAGGACLVCIGRHQDRGMVMVVPYSDLVGPVISVRWNGAAQERAVRAVFDEAGVSPFTEPVGRWKSVKESLKYPLSPMLATAARLIGELFRVGYGLGDLASISFVVHETKTA